MPLLLDDLESDVRHSPVSVRDRRQLARRLFDRYGDYKAADFERVLKPAASERMPEFGGYLRKTIQNIITNGIKKHDHQMVERQLCVRVYFETLMAWECLAENVQPPLLEVLQTNVAEMRNLLDGVIKQRRLWTYGVASQFWDLDGRFHLSICEASDRRHLTSLIKLIIDDCAEIGMAMSVERAAATIEEHTTIVHAIEQRNREKVLDSIDRHVRLGVTGWFGTMKVEDDGKNNSPKSKGRQPRAARVRDIIQEREPRASVVSQLAYERDLPELLKHHESQWVAYLKNDRLGIFETRQLIEEFCIDYCEKNAVELADIAVNRIEPEPFQGQDYRFF